ncbi:hypothetical protein BC830DRAFT_1085049 [Chytriomyces sp. MP71]|nr:hypothetical protein BC830DRAFT_1085049 [Chytriomyces sp. MP71]
MKKYESYEQAILYSSAFFTHILPVTVGSTSPTACMSNSGNTVPPLMVTRRGLEDTKETLMYVVNNFGFDQDMSTHEIRETAIQADAKLGLANKSAASATLVRLLHKSINVGAVQTTLDNAMSSLSIGNPESMLSDDLNFGGFDGINYESAAQNTVGAINLFKTSMPTSVVSNALSTSAMPTSWRQSLLAKTAETTQ